MIGLSDEPDERDAWWVCCFDFKGSDGRYRFGSVGIDVIRQALTTEIEYIPAAVLAQPRQVPHVTTVIAAYSTAD